MRRGTLLLYLVLVAALFGGAPAALAAQGDCAFVRRDAVKAYLRGLPNEVVGWTTCYDQFPETSVFITAHLEKSDAVTLRHFLLQHARDVVADTAETSIVGESQAHDGSQQFSIRSRRLGGKDSSLSYAFVVPVKPDRVLVFIHTEDERKTRQISSVLEKLRMDISRPNFIREVLSAEPSQNRLSLPLPQ